MRIRRLSRNNPRLGLVLLIILSIISTLLGTTPSPVAAQATNLLQNPGFDGDYAPFNGDSTRRVAPNWSAWNVARKATDPGFLLPPQYRAAQDQGRIRTQPAAQEFFEFFASFSGGVFQRVQVTANARVRFSIYINVWSTSLDDPAQSEQPSRAVLEVGIDPTGGTNGESSTVVWNSVNDVYDEFRQLSVEANASGSFVTVFVKVTLPDPVQHNHVFIDDAELVVVSAGAATATSTTVVAATATNTQVVLPTFTPTSTGVAATSTLPPVVTQTPSSTLTPTKTLEPGVPTREGTLPPGPTNTPIAASITPIATLPPGTATPTTVIPGAATPTLSVFPTIPPNLPERILYTVQPGDTVIGIASRFGSTVDAIVAANGLNNSGLILVGQQLIVPVAKLPDGQPTPIPTWTPFIIVTLTPSPVGGAPAPTLPPAPIGSPTAPVDVIPLTGPTVNGIGTYIVQPGDNFEAIARRYRVTVQTLAALNGILNPQRIVIGQVLAVPGPGNNYPGGTAAPTIVPTQPAPYSQTYVVQPGDTLYRVAARFGVSVDAIMRLNGIANPNLIYSGQVLRIP
ncbi:MAG: LysM peptidoglycan-binding domain-containing protein [Anaerolineae bacterium]